MFQRITLVHYHEIGLKGHNRSDFEKRLQKNLKFLLPKASISMIRRISGRICVVYREDVDYARTCAIADSILNIPGVARVSSGYTCARDIDHIFQLAESVVDEAGDFESFKVKARRNHTDFPIESMEINRMVGAHLCEKYPDKKVKMKDPDLTVAVEIVENAAYVYARSIPGVGGLPVGSSGSVMCLLSSGIDSPVALWRLAKRGALCFGVHFSGRPQTAPTSEYLVDDIAHILEKRGGIAQVFVVPFGDYQRQIAAVVPPELRVIIYRRLMMKVAEALAKGVRAKALVTGESLGQVASQTLDNIYVTDEAVSMPVFRPLIGTDKVEIINEAEKLGTFSVSSQDAPDCCTLFMPRNPETHARLAKVLEAEKELDYESWIPQILAEAEIHSYKNPAFKPKKAISTHI